MPPSTAPATPVLNLVDLIETMLDGACPSNVPDAEGWSEFYIETHCVAYIITARSAGYGARWEIAGWAVESV